jgi:putative ribosome biogenesis GTPase RsgA
VVRRSATTLRGQGAAGVRPVTVAGAGQAEVRYRMDPARGALAGASGEGRTTLTVTVAGAAQRFAQRTRTEIAVR